MTDRPPLPAGSEYLDEYLNRVHTKGFKQHGIHWMLLMEKARRRLRYLKLKQATTQFIISALTHGFYIKGWTIWVDPYKLILRPYMFTMDAEDAHEFTFRTLEWCPAILIAWFCKHRQVLP